MPIVLRTRSKVILSLAMVVITSTYRLAADDDADPKEATEKWNVDSPPGESFDQSIDVTEGTWINLDVRPDGKEIVFDLLGDIYTMPIEDADGSDQRYPRRISHRHAWDMQARYNADRRCRRFRPTISGTHLQWYRLGYATAVQSRWKHHRLHQ